MDIFIFLELGSYLPGKTSKKIVSLEWLGVHICFIKLKKNNNNVAWAIGYAHFFLIKEKKIVSLELLDIHTHIQILRNLSRVCDAWCTFVLQPHFFSLAYVYFLKIKNKSLTWLKWEPINICGAVS